MGQGDKIKREDNKGTAVYTCCRQKEREDTQDVSIICHRLKASDLKIHVLNSKPLNVMVLGGEAFSRTVVPS